MNILNKKGQTIGSAHRSVAVIDGELVVQHESMDIDKQYQGRGIGAEFLHDSVLMYEKAGVDHIETSAVSSPEGDVNGAYTWAKLGFQLDPKWRSTLAGKMTDKLQMGAMKWLAPKDQASFRDLAEDISTGKATIQDVLKHPGGKDFLLGKSGLVFGTASSRSKRLPARSPPQPTRATSTTRRGPPSKPAWIRSMTMP